MALISNKLRNSARGQPCTLQIDNRRKSKQAWRPLLGSLADARRDMLRAEIELRGW